MPSTPASEMPPENQSPADMAGTVRGSATVPAMSLWRTCLVWFVKLVTAAGGLVICAQAVCVLFSALHPRLELANHFSLHALCIGVVLIPISLVLRMRGVAGMVSLATVYFAMLTQPWTLVPIWKSAGASASTAVTVLSWNMLTANNHHAEIQDLVREVNPDILVLIEVRPELIEQLPDITRAYPHAIERPGWGGTGIAVFSRIDCTRLEFNDFGYAQQPAVIATIPGVDGSELKLVALHALSPLPVERSLIRDGQLRAVRDWSAVVDKPQCICGDFNTTPWTRAFQDLIGSGFIDARHGRGNGASWPAPLGWLGIPIDHVLTKGDCRLSDRRVLPTNVGSDHFPIVFKIQF